MFVVFERVGVKLCITKVVFFATDSVKQISISSITRYSGGLKEWPLVALSTID